MEKKLTAEETPLKPSEDVIAKLDLAGNDEKKAAELGLPHGPERGKYDAHETEVLDAKARDQRRVLRERNQKGEDNDAENEGKQEQAEGAQSHKARK